MCNATRIDAKSVAGFTLVEVVFTLAVGVIVIVGIGSALIASVSAYNGISQTIAVDNDLRRIHQVLSQELRYLDTGTLAIKDPAGSPSITFQSVSGWDGNKPVLGGAQVLEFKGGALILADKELCRGLDDASFSFANGILSVSFSKTATVTRGDDVLKISREFSSPVNL